MQSLIDVREGQKSSVEHKPRAMP